VLILATIVPALVGSGCYTAVKGPATAADFYNEPQHTLYSSETGDTDELLVPRRGSSNPYDDPYRGFSSPYGGGYGGYGGPAFGYDSRGGAFGNYGYGNYGYGGYYRGAGPVGYGYDPYYSGAYGSYVPPGYELVTTNELDYLRSNAILNTTPTYNPPDPVLQQQRVEAEQEVWQQRQESRNRPTPAVTSRSSNGGGGQTSRSAPAVTRRPAAQKSTGSQSDGDSKKKSAKPKKRGR
jgi:hypothetical protein